MNSTTSNIPQPSSKNVIQYGGNRIVDSVIERVKKEIDDVRLSLEAKKKDRCIRNLREKIGKFRSYPCGMSLSSEALSLLQGTGIKNEILPASLKYYILKFKTKNIHGVGFLNVNNGLEFYSPQLNGFVTIANKGLLYFNSNMGNNHNSDVCVFMNFLDYLAFLSFISNSGKNVARRSIVVNSYENFPEVIIKCDHFKQILCFFPKDGDSYMVLNKTFENRYGVRFTDMSYIYTNEGYDCMSDYYRELVHPSETL